VEAVLSDFVRLREESSYLEVGMLLEGGTTGLHELMADDEDRFQSQGEWARGAAVARRVVVVPVMPAMVVLAWQGAVCGARRRRRDPARP
jgi:hypothetical protein